ncbi:MAG: hypothetical protein V3U76_03650 [Granulosicoccus sp.]
MTESGNGWQRQLERHGAVGLRALSGTPLADYRARRLRVNGQPVAFAAPYLAIDFSTASLTQSRGVMDSLGLRLKHSDFALHQDLSPPAGFSRLLFDVLEQLRCDSLFDASQRGLRGNLDAAFLQWCQTAHASGIADSRLGILLYTVIHMVRARLIGTLEDEEAEALVEATRGNIAPLIGSHLYQLRSVCDDQSGYAALSNCIAHTLAELVDAEAHAALDDAEELRQRYAIVLPPDWRGDADVDEQVFADNDGVSNVAISTNESAEASLDRLGDYHVFSKEFDRTVTGESLFNKKKQTRLRANLDCLIAAQTVSVSRLASELNHLFADPQRDGWVFAQDEGLVDARRLSQLVSNPSYQQIFVQERWQPHSDAVVSFLIDNTGSMKRQRFKAVAVLVDTFCRALTLAGVTTEVLGFSTGDWNGGRAMKAWRGAGQPTNPGRLGESLHIVYKSAGQSWRRARPSLAGLLDTQHFREGLDGEALVWAYRRLQLRPESRRYLVVISDGAPMDAATFHANRDGFLSDYLAHVVRHVEGGAVVRIGGIGVDLDLSDIYRHCVSLDLGGTLGPASYRVLQHLFA